MVALWIVPTIQKWYEMRAHDAWVFKKYGAKFLKAAAPEKNIFISVNAMSFRVVMGTLLKTQGQNIRRDFSKSSISIRTGFSTRMGTRRTFFAGSQKMVNQEVFTNNKILAFYAQQ